MLQHGFGFACGLQKGAGRRRHGDPAKLQNGRCRCQKRQRFRITFGNRQARQAAIRSPAGKILKQPVVPAFRPAKKKADAVIQHIGLRIDRHTDRKACGGQLGKLVEKGCQRRINDTAADRRDNPVRAALEKPGGHPAGQSFQMKAGPPP